MKHLAKNIVVEGIIVVLLLAGIMFSSIGGKMSDNKKSYSQELNLQVSRNSEFIWNVETPVDMGSLVISGTASINGVSKVYIENNGVRYIMFDSSTLSKIMPTGLAAAEHESNDDNIRFEEVCLETCFLNGFDKMSYKLVIEVEDGANLTIENIDYTKKEQANQQKQKPWVKFAIGLVLIVPFIALGRYAMLKSKRSLPEGFRDRLTEAHLQAKKERKKAIKLYHELRSEYLTLTKSEKEEKVKKHAYEELEKIYNKLSK